MVEVSDRGLPCHEFEPSTTKDPPYKQRPLKDLLDHGIEVSPSTILKKVLEVSRKATRPSNKQFPVQKQLEKRLALAKTIPILDY
ncbi:hypothetical protein TNCV_1907261 [Trichonephila clavipes]|nr:hypothetical protein TNCV_1907261 [Trichonephila clavipes]